MNSASQISAFKDQSVLVIGDVMLDRFVYGEVNRISPEGPIPVLLSTREERMLGGAGNVIANLRGLGAHATAVAVIGADEDGHAVRALIEGAGASSAGLLAVADRPTISKTRFISGHQQMLRVDGERAVALPDTIEDALIANIRAQVPQHKAVVLSDYGKGVLSARVIDAAISTAKAQGIPVIVDPKGSDYSRYRGASVVTPNRKELAEATGGLPTGSDEEVEAAALQLIASSGIEAVVATRSQDGMSVMESGRPVQHFRTQALEVFDVSGAGDTVVAVVAACLASGVALGDAARLANVAGGIVVAKVGTSIIKADELADKIETEVPANRHIHTWDEAREQVRRWQARGLKVGFTNGCFDILHAGHVNYLNETRKYCDRLVLGLNHDASVRILKGPTRPVNVEGDRATVMAGLSAVSMVALFGATAAGEDNTPCDLIAYLRPDIFFKGGDYTIDKLPEAGIVHGYGGEVRIMGLTEGLSTTRTIAKIEAGKAA